MNDRELAALGYCLILAGEGDDAWDEAVKLWEAYNSAYK